MIFGILWGALNRFLCKGLCPVCTTQQLSPCFFLFLFVGIIFIIAGYSITTMKCGNLPEIRLKKNR